MQTNTLRKPHGKDISTARKGVSLEHRHFAFIASVIADMDVTAEQREQVTEAFCDACNRTNPNFSATRFIAACFAKDAR